MPIKLSRSNDQHEARIEIIPLIDIMFFLLASFMLVSLSTVNLNSVKVNLPTATTGSPDRPTDVTDISVDTKGGIFIDRHRLTDRQVIVELANLHRDKPSARVMISADTDARHGDVIHALDLIRAAGIDRVAFATSPTSSKEEH